MCELRDRQFIRSSIETVGVMVTATDLQKFRQEPRIHQVTLVNGATIVSVDVEYGMPHLPKGNHPPLWAIDGKPDQVQEAAKTLDQSPITTEGADIAAKVQELAMLIENVPYEDLYGGSKTLGRICKDAEFSGTMTEKHVFLSAVMSYISVTSRNRRNKAAYGSK